MESTVFDKRIYFPWIDWMKAIGIILIVFGHFGGWGSLYAYVFNVPLFFIISGFLGEKQTVAYDNNGERYNEPSKVSDDKSFYRKLLWNLIIPMIIISIMTLGIRCFIDVFKHDFSPSILTSFIPDFLLGRHNALINMWFVYTLMVQKIIYRLSSPNQYLQCIVLIVLLAIGWYINSYGGGGISPVHY